MVYLKRKLPYGLLRKSSRKSTCPLCMCNTFLSTFLLLGTVLKNYFQLKLKNYQSVRVNVIKFCQKWPKFSKNIFSKNVKGPPLTKKYCTCTKGMSTFDSIFSTAHKAISVLNIPFCRYFQALQDRLCQKILYKAWIFKNALSPNDSHKIR